MDEVECIGLIRPGPRHVVTLEFEIGWDPLRLSGRDVDTDDLGLRILVGKVTGLY